MNEKKILTQEDVNAELARAREKWEAKRVKFVKEIEERDVIVTAARERIAELETCLATERETLAAAVASHRQFRVGLAIDGALERAHVMPGKGKQHAQHFFHAEFEFQTDDAGAITSATRRADGQAFESLEKALKAFEKENGHLFMVPRPPAGSGLTLPSLNGGSAGAWRARNDPSYRRADPTTANPVDLIQKGLKAPSDQQ